MQVNNSINDCATVYAIRFSRLQFLIMLFFALINLNYVDLSCNPLLYDIFSNTATHLKSEGGEKVDMSATIVFVHVPKTGGLSVFSALSRLFATASVCSYYEGLPSSFRGMSLVSSHDRLVDLEKVEGDKIFITTNPSAGPAGQVYISILEIAPNRAMRRKWA